MNCKPGDMAIMINAAPDFDRNIGSLFEVIEEARGYPGFRWWVKTLNTVLGFDERTQRWENIPPGRLAICADRFLRPLQPPPEDEQIDDSVPLTPEKVSHHG